eukprot:TRINITY_DN37809_c0_g1_i1.p1 TRINITY_DN37809_c0_g1~~TRINITY_DN37809_c0_g1_i1.p1  ORF type:complete len:126 (-),score=0.58 TRINITY_DN37809_c0_g1_i1:282-659(-)
MSGRRVSILFLFYHFFSGSLIIEWNSADEMKWARDVVLVDIKKKCGAGAFCLVLYLYANELLSSNIDDTSAHTMRAANGLADWCLQSFCIFLFLTIYFSCTCTCIHILVLSGSLKILLLIKKIKK